MDKSDFVKEAPLVYALAIATELNKGGVISKLSIQRTFRVSDDNEPDGNFVLVQNNSLWDAAVDWLVENDMVVVSKPSFGPALYSEGPGFASRWQDLSNLPGPFGYYALVDEKWDWLVAALYDVSNEYHALNITPEDFTLKGDDWEPIKLDTSLPSYKNAVEKLDEAVKRLREDNGYAASFPEERDFVVGGLEKTVQQLETGTVTSGYIRDAWEKLKIAGKRFGGAGLGLVIAGAQQAIVEFVRQQGGELLRMLSRLLSGG